MKKLSKKAYGGVKGEDYIPYVEDGKTRKATNTIILVMGCILAAMFSASTAYSGMKAGLTVAAGIPGAIIGSGLVSLFAKDKGILGKNIIQGMSSGGESIASGSIYVLPAIILIGAHVDFLTGIIIGAMAVFFSIGIASLVENYLIIQEHGKIVYPESMAISESLVASETGGESLKMMGIGFGIGGIFTAITNQVFGWMNQIISLKSHTFYKWKFSTEVNPLLAGIGFVVGLNVAVTVFAGSILANFVVVPLLHYFTSMADSSASVWNDASMAIANMGVDELTGAYTKYIGAGMMLGGGIIGAIQLIPVIIKSLQQTISARKEQTDNEKSATSMLPLLVAIAGIFIIGIIISKSFLMALIGAGLALILSLLFVIVAGRLAGTIGCSNLPVSGMTIASLVIMTLVFVMMGWTNKAHSATLLWFGVFIVIAIAVAGGYMQTQKVTFIIGGSRREMSRAFMLAALVGVVVVIGITVLLSPQLAQTGSNPPFALPQANLIATLVSGIMSGNLPWVMVIAGLIMAIVLWMLKLPIMTVALGFYLPISTTSIILVGALVRWIVETSTRNKTLREQRVQNGISLSSGLIAGGSIIGLIGIILHVSGILKDKVPTGFLGSNTIAVILLTILILSMLLAIFSLRKPHEVDEM